MEFLQELEVIMVSILKIRGVNRETMKTGGSVHPGGGGVLPYLGYVGTCRWTGYGFWPRCPKQGIKFDLPLS